MLGLIRIFLVGLLLASSTAGSAELKNGEYHAVLNGVRHWYRVAGAEHHTAPIVVIHGGPGGSVYAFEHGVGPRIQQFATMVYYDQRGSGRSDAPVDDNAYGMGLITADLDALRQQLGVDKIIPFGYSFGAQIAFEYALRYPSHIEKLIVQSAANGDWARITRYQAYGFALNATAERRAKLEALAAAPITNVPDLSEAIWSGVDQAEVNRLLFHSQAAADLNNRLIAESRKHCSRPNSGKMARVAFSAPPRNPSLMSEISKIAVPTLVMVGLYDHNVGVDSNREIAESIPNSTLVIFEKSAHFPDMEEPEKYAATVRRFLQQTNR